MGALNYNQIYNWDFNTKLRNSGIDMVSQNFLYISSFKKKSLKFDKVLRNYRPVEATFSVGNLVPVAATRSPLNKNLE